MRSNRIVLAACIAITAAATCFAGPLATAPQTGGAAAPATKFDPSVARPMSADDLKKQIDTGSHVVIVDAREDLAGEIVKGAVQVTDDQLVAWSDKAPKDVPLVFYCTCDDDGLAIGEVVGLQNLGFTNAYYLKGGLEAARKAGIPIVKPAA
jgi:rhodanese-related sulfurtransferase